MPNQPESEVLQTAPNYGIDYLDYINVTQTAPVCVPACCRGAAGGAGLPCQAAGAGRGAAPCSAARRPAVVALVACRRFKNESEYVPQSGYFSVDVPGVHIVSLHSYVRPERMPGGGGPLGAGEAWGEAPLAGPPSLSVLLTGLHACTHAMPSFAAAALGQGVPAVPLAGAGPGGRCAVQGRAGSAVQCHAGQPRGLGALHALPPPHSPSTHPHLPPLHWVGLSAVDRAATPFVVVGFHAAIYHSYVEQYKQADTFRDVMEPLLVRHGVDLVLAGHVHRCVCAPAAPRRCYGVRSVQAGWPESAAGVCRMPHAAGAAPSDALLPCAAQLRTDLPHGQLDSQ